MRKYYKGKNDTKLARRIGALEAKLVKEPTVLYFPDGSTRELSDGSKMELFHAVLRGSVTPQRLKQLEIIRQCIGAREPGGSHFVEVTNAFWIAKCSKPDPELDRCEGV